MCGIFAFLGTQVLNTVSTKYNLINKGSLIQHRGPDSTTYSNYTFDNKNLFVMFHRLAINGLDSISNQPFVFDNFLLICNGEIYNYKHLIDKYDLHNEYKTHSDCEIIIHLYKKIGIDSMLNEINGHFAFMLVDFTKNDIIIARDPIGIRSLYIVNDINNNQLCISSEMKSLVDLVYDNKLINQFPPGTYFSYKNNNFTKYFAFDDFYNDNETEETIIDNIRKLFIKSVETQLVSDRKIACLVSGGLDSTTTAAVIATHFNKYVIDTYSIGMKGSVDLYWADIAAKYLGTNHTTIELTENDFLNAIEETIYQIESYDTTTVRASVGNYLVSKYIKKNSDNTVIFCGDVSDELFAGYRGFTCAKNDRELFNENIKMINNIHYFDVLRAEKSIMGAGLEARVPFSDKYFMKYIMSIDPKYKKFDKNRIEKHIFRKAFESYLPHDLIWRRKEAFSDGVSGNDKSWYQIIQEFVDTKISDDDFIILREQFTINKPYDKESLYYRLIFKKYYNNCDHVIPYYWKHPFNENKDPSARSLDCY